MTGEAKHRACRLVCGMISVGLLAAVLHGQEVAATSRPTTKPADEAAAAAKKETDDKALGKPAEHELPPVVITGKKPPVEQGDKSIFTALPPRDLIKRPLTESPGLETATTVVGKEEIRWLDAYSLVDAMKYTPGAWTETRGRKVKQFFSVRGQRYPYPTYVVDGAWQREFHESTYFFNAANVERIELVRSSSALLLGPGGMTGLIHVIPRTYTKPETRLDVEYGRFNTWLTNLNHGNALADGKLSYGVGIGYHHTDGPDNWNAEENIGNFYGRIVYKPVRPLTLSLTGYGFHGQQFLKRARRPASANLLSQRDHFDPMTMYMLVGKARYEPSERASTEITGSYAHRRFFGNRIGSDDWTERDYEYGTRVIQGLKIGDRNTLRFGGMFNRWVSPTGKRFYVGRRGDLSTYSGVIVDEHDFGKLDVNVGYRLSHTRVDKFGGFNVEGAQSRNLRQVEDVENEWEDPLQTLTAGASYALSEEWSLHGNFAVGQIAAKPGMLDEDLKRPGTERRMKFDLGVRRQWDAFGEVSLTGFYVRQKETAVLTGAKVTNPQTGVEFGLYENADRDSYGVELDLRTKRFDSGFQFFFNAVAMQSRQERADGEWIRAK
ncbi:MAG: TonB-dependent receptor plug domain-containing protein, partial [Phycisphaerae bacterium]